MATLPPWLGGFNPGDVFNLLASAKVNAANQQRAQVNDARDAAHKARTLALTEREQAFNEQARANELALREMSLRQGLTSDMGKLALEREKAQREAQEAAIRYQGTQDLQAALAQGIPFEEAIQKHLPSLAIGNPGALTSFSNTLNRTKSSEEIAREKMDDRIFLANLFEAGKDRRLDKTEAGKDERAAQDRQNRLAVVSEKAKNLIPKLTQPQKKDLDYRLEKLLYNFTDSPEVIEQKRAAIIDEFESKLGQGSGAKINPAQKQVQTAPIPIKTDEEYEALESGTQFIGPDGKIRTKP